MSYVCTGCGAKTDTVVLVCHNCQRWSQHLERLLDERDELRHVIDRLDCTRREGGDTRHCRVDRKCLRCERDHLRDMLREVEWASGLIEPPMPARLTWYEACPICQRVSQDGHAPDCELAAALEGR